jgi:hypothetical protein
MQLRALAVLSLISLASTSATAESAYWLVARNSQNYDFVNSSTINKMADGAVWAWVMTVNVGNEYSKSGDKYTMTYAGYPCASNMISSEDFVKYGKFGEVIKSFGSNPTPWERVIPDSFGEAEKNFVCTDPSNWEKLAEPVENYRENLRDPARLADYLYAREHRSTTQSPGRKHRVPQ